MLLINKVVRNPPNIKKTRRKIMKKDKNINELQVVLTVLYVSALLVSNVVTTRQIQLPFGFNATGAIFLFPITYVLSDVFSECYGYKWSRKTCYMAFAMNLLMVTVFMITLSSPYPVWFAGADAFKTVLSSTPRTMVASFLAFVLGDFVNDKIFAKMKAKHNGLQGFEWRAILSSFFGECVDGLIFTPIAFLGTMSARAMLNMVIVNISLKVGYEVIVLPITRTVAKKVNQYEQ